jgi:hypothetical protein
MITTEQLKWSPQAGYDVEPVESMGDKADLVLVFGSRSALENHQQIDQIRSRYPHALLAGCSTAGEILATEVLDDTLVITAASFEHTKVKGIKVAIDYPKDSYDAGLRLAGSLEKEELVHVFVLSDGLKINGSDLVRGLTQDLPEGVTVTGGLSGDGDRFERTFVLLDQRKKQGHRFRPGHRVRNRDSERRLHQRLLNGRRRHEYRNLAAQNLGEGGRDPRDRDRIAGRGEREDPARRR